MGGRGGGRGALGRDSAGGGSGGCGGAFRVGGAALPPAALDLDATPAGVDDTELRGDTAVTRGDGAAAPVGVDAAEPRDGAGDCPASGGNERGTRPTTADT